QIESGEIQVFDTSTFTVDGKEVTTAFALDTDGDFAPDSEEAVFDGAFHESYFQSAPYFALRIDGIKLLNEAY
ncbi:MAG: BMP family ABC transporter substrate-binding protein, partial [Firmicutes bacterium]|nr:BMP family ABC transporter substrate-binding protein [Bacillota bacterium]